MLILHERSGPRYISDCLYCPVKKGFFLTVYAFEFPSKSDNASCPVPNGLALLVFVVMLLGDFRVSVLQTAHRSSLQNRVTSDREIRQNCLNETLTHALRGP